MQLIDSDEYWQSQRAAYFQELSSFGAMPETVVRRLVQEGRVVRLEAGEVLYTAGEPSHSFFIVLSGTVHSYMPRKDGGWALARCHQAGDDMGFVPMIALCERPASTIAEEESTVVEISSDQFLLLHEQDPDAFGLLLLNLVRGMARAIINMAGMLADLNAELHTTYPTALKREEGDETPSDSE